VDIFGNIVTGAATPMPSTGIAEVLTYATSTFSGFDAIIAATIGIALAIGLIRKFVRTG